MTKYKLEEYRKNVLNCARCGVCVYKYNENVRKICPAWEHSPGFDTYNARGKMMIARGILGGRFDYSPAMAEVLTWCTTCGNCAVQCGMTDTNTGDLMMVTPQIVEAMRADVVDLGLCPAAYKHLGTRIEKVRNSYGEPKENRKKWAEGLNVSFAENAKTVLFVGCTAAYRRQEIATNTAEILNKLGIQFSLMKDEWCCGNPLLRTGQMTPAKEVAQHNLEQLKNAETVITACAECNRTLRIDYPKMGLEVPQVMHITEFLSGLLDEGKLKLEKPVNMKVTYHDPCYMSRRMDFGIYDEPRKLLSAIPGLELVEMENTRENTWCCGAGGAFKIAHPVEAVESGVDRLGHAVKVGAEVIVSSCPFCKANFVDAVKETESKLQVYDITELIAKSMGV